MIFKHNKNISRNLILIYCCVFFISSCGGGGGDSFVPESNQLTFSVIGLPSTLESYDEVSIQIVPSIEGCVFGVYSQDLLWLSSSDDLNFNFRAPIIHIESKEFSFGISPLNTTVKPECNTSKNFIFNVTRNQTEFIPNPDPSNISYLSLSLIHI